MNGAKVEIFQISVRTELIFRLYGIYDCLAFYRKKTLAVETLASCASKKWQFIALWHALFKTRTIIKN